MPMMPIPAIRNTGAWQQRWHHVAFFAFAFAVLLHIVCAAQLYYGLRIFPDAPALSEAERARLREQEKKKLAFVVLEDKRPDETPPQNALAQASHSRQASARVITEDDAPPLPAEKSKALMIPTFIGSTMRPSAPAPTPPSAPPTPPTQPQPPVERPQPAPAQPAKDIPEVGIKQVKEPKIQKVPTPPKRATPPTPPARRPAQPTTPSSSTTPVPFRALPKQKPKPYGTQPTSPRSGGVSVSESPSFALLKARWPEYMKIVSQKIQQSLNRQQSLAPRSFHRGLVVMQIRIEPDGSVTNIKEMSAPASMLSERTVCKLALEDAGPFPPLTEEMQKDGNFKALGINVLFQ